ncbi:metallophosphoesterase [Paraliomyxa miuraensis]|uniref:metallophosphoesterase n=1 Tax=Paraliomyxa miuraensis TaxID=376150 RepID=UPI003899E823
MTFPPILHISDLHFRADDPKADQRHIVLRGALDIIRTLADAESLRPGIVCVTGDVAWGGRQQDYDLAAQWFEDVRSALDLSFEDFVVCPGNHDAERRFAVELERPEEVSSVDSAFERFLANSNELSCLSDAGGSVHLRIRPFCDFIRFCHRLGLSLLDQGKSQQGYLWGVRVHKGARFVVLNSAWLSKDRYDERKLHIGSSLLERMISQCGLAPLEPGGTTPLTLAMVHHPRDWLAEACRCTFPPRVAEWAVLSRSVHAILHGHTHEPRGPMTRVLNEAVVIPAGSAEAGIRFPNCFHLLKVDSCGQLKRTSWTLDNTDPAYAWHQDPDEIPASLPGLWRRALESPAFDTVEALTEIRKEVLTFVRRKQDALPHRRELPLPKSRLVTDIPADHLANVRRSPTCERPFPLAAAVDASRLVLVLGEIGAGKSTLCGQLALTVIDEGRPALVLPLRGLAFPRGIAPGEVWERLVAAVIERSLAFAAIPRPIADEFIATSTLILDGLDELAADEVDGLLGGCEAAVRAKPSVHIVASGRPDRVDPFRYRRWRTVSTRMLDPSEVDAMVEEELGSGKEADARAIIKRISESPVLAALVTTPLLVRLLTRSMMQCGDSELRTSGDLLRQICLERLGEWDRRETRLVGSDLAGSWPDATARMRSLARVIVLARGSNADRVVFIDRLAGDASAAPSPRAAAAALLEFSVGVSLLTCEPSVQVESHRLSEFLCGEGIAELLVRGETVSVTPDAWREWSYASASLRHRGVLPDHRDVLTAVIQALVKAGNPAGAAYVVWESQDPQIAESLLGLLRELGPRPMTLWMEERADSARAAAGAVLLAGEIGFEWFVDTYLNPFLPDPWAGGAHDSAIIAWWCQLNDSRTLGPEQIQRLWQWASPRLAFCRPYHDMNLAAVCSLIPAEFPVPARINLLRDLLDSGTLGARAEKLLRYEFDGVHDGIVRNALAARAGSRDAPSFASARLWLALVPEELEPSVVDGVLGAGERGDQSSRWLAAIQECRRRMGEATWGRYLRWSLYGWSDCSRGAAVALFWEGERSMAVLGWPLLNAMHDGARTSGAEAAFATVLEESGASGWAWFQTRMVEAAEGGRFEGPHAGWWRIFLHRLSGMGSDGVQLFISALRGLSEFVLPRNADLRDTIAALLNGPDGTEYREQVTACLKAFDPSIRVAAAATLAISGREPDLEVLIPLLLAVGGGVDSPLQNHWEWVDMLGGLHWSTGAVSRLRPARHNLPKGPRVLALFIMDLHGVALSASENQELALALLTGEVRGERIGRGHPWFAGEAGRTRLLDLANGEGEGQREAASVLIRLHADSLTTDHRARAAVTGLSWSTWSARLLRRELRVAQIDDTYAKAIVEQDSQQVAVAGAPSPLARLLSAVRTGEGWREIISRMYGLTDDRSNSGEVGAATFWLLDLARDGGTAARIGEAALAVIAMPAPSSLWDRSARPWLAILADELAPTGDLSFLEDELRHSGERGLDDPRPALLARIRRHGRLLHTSHSLPPVPTPAAPRSFGGGLDPAVSTLRSLANDASSKCIGARELLRLAAITFKDGDEDPVPSIGDGRNHALLRGATQFILFGRVAPEVVAQAFPIHLYNIEQDHDLKYLAEVWRHVLRRGLTVTPGARDQIENVLRGRLRSDHLYSPEIGYLLLDLGVPLSEDDLEIVLTGVASWSFRDDYGLLPRLADSLTRDPRPDVTIGILARALALADGAKESHNNSSDIATGPLFLAALYWVLGGSERETTARVVIRSLGVLWRPQRAWGDQAESPDPALHLLRRVSPELLRDVLRRGVKEGTPATEAMCSFILAAFAAPAVRNG